MATEDEDVPGRDFIEAAGCSAGPEHLERDVAFLRSEHDLESLRSQFQGKPTTTEPAFQAIALIAEAVAAQVPPDALDRIETVAVPWWIVRALRIAWGRYRFDGLPLDKAFALPLDGHVNPAARGRLHQLRQRDKEERDIGLAVEVAEELRRARAEGRPTNATAAIATVEERHGLKDRTMWGIWMKHGKKAQRLVAAQADASKNRGAL